MKFLFAKNHSGQSVMEYLLLLLVVTSLVFTVLNSQAFLALMGPDSAFFERLKTQQEYSYRHTHLSELDDTSSYDGIHHSYVNPATNTSRFFSTTKAYPQQ